MFAKNCHQNSFLTKSCPKLQQDLMNKCVTSIFTKKFTDLHKCEKMATVNDCKKFCEKSFTRGYGRIGFENLIASLSMDNLDVIQRALSTLKAELKNASLIPRAVDLGVLDKLHTILFKASSFAKPSIIGNSLKLLNYIACDFKGAQAIAKNEDLLKLILEYMRTQKDLEALSAEVLHSLSAVPYVVNQLPPFVVQELQSHMHVSSNDIFFYALSNFISRNPTEFATANVVSSLLKKIHHAAALKCLSLIVNCDDGLKVAHSMDIESYLVEIIFTSHDDELKTHAVAALRNCLINKELFSCESDFPWQHLLAKLIEMSKSKINKQLQRCSIQALRVMSDAAAVKDRLGKVYKRELRGIQCMTSEAKDLKDDLLQWLEYRNYELNEGNKYSKYFI